MCHHSWTAPLDLALLDEEYANAREDENDYACVHWHGTIDGEERTAQNWCDHTASGELREFSLNR